MNGYAEVPTRKALDGTIDKLALVESMASDTAHDREFAEFVLQKVAKVGSSADEQAACWCQYVESLPYRRERAEVLRDPRLVVGSGGRIAAGGDCDDMVVAVLAGLRSLAIPCQAEIVATEDGWGFHIRALVGLPPLRPTVWTVVDPVWKSEREWTMIDKPAKQSALMAHSPWLSGPVPAQAPSMPSLSIPVLLLIGLSAFLAHRLLTR